MSLNLTFIGPPLPITERGSSTKIYVHNDGETIIYGNKNAVIARNINDPNKMPTVYSEHLSKVKVAAFSPNGNYVASGDESGKVRIWAYTHPDKLLKKEVSTMSRGVRDLSWGGDGKRIVASGDGQKKAIAFSWDTGSELGQMTGMTSTGNCVAFKKVRPFRIVVGCEAAHSYFFSGPPFKMTSTKKDHSNMLTSCKFSPDGSKYVTVSSDKQAFLYDGKTGEQVGKLSNKKKDRHNATIYDVDFSHDGNHILTASSDKTLKVWEAASGALQTTLKVGAPKPQIRDQQVAGLFTKAGPLSLSLCGELNIFNPEEPDAPARRIEGHQVTAVSLALDSAGGIYTGDQEGVVCQWKGGVPTRIRGQVDPKDDSKVHKGSVEALALHAGTLVSGGIDGKLIFTDITTREIKKTEDIGAPVVAMASASGKGNITLVLTANECLHSIVDGALTSKLDLGGEAGGVAINSDGSLGLVTIPRSRQLLFVKVGEAGELSLDGNPMTFTEAPLAVAISPDSSTVAVSEGSGVVTVDVAKRDTVIEGYFMHNAKVTTIEFAPNGTSIVSGAKDGYISLWKTDDKKAKCTTQGHFQGVIGLKVADENTIFSVGVDRCLRRHTIGAVETGEEGGSK